MRVMSASVEKALKHWQKGGLLTDAQAAKLRANMPSKAGDEEGGRAIGIFSSIGGILIGLGVILFFASNWASMTPTIKVIVLELGVLLSAYAGYDLSYKRKTYPKVGQALLFLNILLFGASIFLVAQIFHLPMNFWLGGLLWFIGAAYFSYVLQSRLHMWLAVPLLILFLGWLRSTSITGFGDEFDFLFSGRTSILKLFPLIGTGLIGASILHEQRKYLTFASDTLFHWGLFLILLVFVASTAEKGILFEYLHLDADYMTVAIILFSLAASIAAFFTGNFRTKDGRAGLVALLCYTAFVYFLSHLPRLMGLTDAVLTNWYQAGLNDLPMIRLLFILHVVLVFVGLLLAVWYGIQLKRPAVINMSMLAIAVLIFIQYVTYAFSLRSRSLFFIGGGILLLLLSTYLERKRRDLLAHL